MPNFKFSWYSNLMNAIIVSNAKLVLTLQKDSNQHANPISLQKITLIQAFPSFALLV